MKLHAGLTIVEALAPAAGAGERTSELHNDHRLARTEGESLAAFCARVARYAWSLKTVFEIVHVRYVFDRIGDGCEDSRQRVVQSLGALVDKGGSLTLVGCGPSVVALPAVAAVLTRLVAAGVSVNAIP